MTALMTLTQALCIHSAISSLQTDIDAAHSPPLMTEHGANIITHAPTPRKHESTAVKLYMAWNLSGDRGCWWGNVIYSL